MSEEKAALRFGRQKEGRARDSNKAKTLPLCVCPKSLQVYLCHFESLSFVWYLIDSCSNSSLCISRSELSATQQKCCQ